MSVLDPLSHALAAVVAATHAALSALGAGPASGLTWVLCIAAVVVVVRAALLPLTIHSVRQAHAAARARPALQALARELRDRRDPESLRAFTEQRRRIAAEHGMSRGGLLPVLAQVPIWLALYHLLAGVVAGVPVGAMNAGLVASLGAATVLGVPLAERGYLGGGWVHVAVVSGLALAAALLSFVTQRYFVAPNTVMTDLPDAVVSAHRLMPGISALGLIVAGGFAPVALLVYWVCNSAWTMGQSAIVWRWFPTPGSRAASRSDRLGVVDEQ
ncbi:MAG: membrane protein insertase YidC [Nocardioides sp.]|nr:membrane protein insertase YidC [Nocardioides sp.]